MSAMLHPALDGRAVYLQAFAAAIRPRRALTVSEWADAERHLSSKGSAEPGKFRSSRNPPMREPMDCMSARSGVQDVTLMFPIQFCKTLIAENVVGYTMCHNPGPIMVALPGEASMNKWIQQKLNPMIEVTPAIQNALTSSASRDGANRREFKDFIGGQLYLEHAGSPARLKSTSVRTLIVDELDDFASAMLSGDDPVDLLEGRTSAFPGTYKRLFIGTPGIKGVSRVEARFEKSDQRRRYVPCPHCEHEQPLMWPGLQWITSGQQVTQVWYVCRECGAVIDEHHKTAMIAAGRWVAENPGAKTRGYHINALYYQIGLGPRWLTLVEMWLAAQNDNAKLKTFINDRLAEVWEDPAMRAVKHNIIADRAEAYRLRVAPHDVLAVTAGVDTQDNRLAVHILGHGRGLLSTWTLDYIELMGDPALPHVWDALTELLNTPIEHARGCTIGVSATAIDAGGHRTEAVKAYVRQGLIRRPMCIFGAVPNNAPVLSKGKLQDERANHRTDKRGTIIYQVGTVAIKHHLYSRLSTDADVTPDKRRIHFSDQLPLEWFAGLVSESYNPSKNRFEKKRGARNEPLDTWGYAYAATHHPELRLHRKTRIEWDAIEALLGNDGTWRAKDQNAPRGTTAAALPTPQISTPPRSTPPASSSGFGNDDWNL